MVPLHIHTSNLATLHSALLGIGCVFTTSAAPSPCSSRLQVFSLFETKYQNFPVVRLNWRSLLHLRWKNPLCPVVLNITILGNYLEFCQFSIKLFTLFSGFHYLHIFPCFFFSSDTQDTFHNCSAVLTLQLPNTFSTF